MSQSAAEIDLPDPQEKPAGANAADASSDDLLAQLAGQEIDRLLAQSQTETAPPTEESAPTGTPIVEQVDQPAEPEAAAPVAVPEVVPQAVVAAPPPSPAKPPAPEIKDPPKPGLLDNFEKAHAARDEATGSAERDALSTESTIDPLKALDAIDGGESDDDDSDESTPHASDDDDSDKMPIYLMPLALLNAPFKSLDTETRELFGKVALITFVNAIAVLIYIVLFRR